MVEDIARAQSIDRKRIFATGMSNGGMMTYRVGCEMADVFAAIAPVAGALDTDGCKPSAPVSLVAFHGKADQHVRFDGGAPVKTVGSAPLAQSTSPSPTPIDFWKREDRCETPVHEPEEGQHLHEAYACRATSTAVELYAIDGQGQHGRATRRHRAATSTPTTEISATSLMWDFFARHPRN